MRTIEVKIYKFDELNEKAQEKAIDKLSHVGFDFGDWYDHIFDYEEFKEQAEKLNVDLRKDFEFEDKGGRVYGKWTFRFIEDFEEKRESLIELCNSLGDAIQKEIDFLSSREYVVDFIHSNEYEFLESGEIA